MILNFTDPFFTTRVLGFEALFDRLQRLAESNERSSSYPPYNISKDGNLFAIEIAVAGLSKDDIEVELADGVLSLSLIHISEPTRRTPISYAVFCLKKNIKLCCQTVKLYCFWRSIAKFGLFQPLKDVHQQ